MSYAALPTLRTPRLTLRPLTPTDADAVFHGVSNFDVIRWLGRIPYPYGREDAVAFISRVRDECLSVWAVEDAQCFVGIVGIDEELGYWFARPAWGKGYGFEAAVAVLQHWYSDPERGDVASGHYNENARSQRILRALGFQPVAQRRRFARALSQDVMGTDMVLTRAAWEARQEMDIRTARLRLRPLVEEDAPFLIDLARPEVTRMLFSLRPDLSDDEARAFIRARRWRGLPGFALKIEKDGQPIGYVATGNSHGVELYYALHPDHWRQGIMGEAVQAFLADLFARFPINRVIADRFEDNPASGRLLETCGFVETGRGIGHSAGRLEPAPVITYALTRDRHEIGARRDRRV